MTNDRLAARQQIEKLVQFFDTNIYQFKSPTFNETQARGQLIDPFFEALGWDVHNRLMQPLFRQEVVPESRVKTNVGKEVREQEALFPRKNTLGNGQKEYASILDYIAEDEYKASSKEAVKKPDYRFRIGGQTKFFVEAKKPYVDLAKSQSAIFQVKRYGFSGRVPLAILTDFEEFRTFDCTQRPAFEKPKLGVIHDFDLTYKQYVDHFERLYDTFSRDAVVGGSLEALTKKMMLKRTGDFALDREFLDDLSKWREELARDIAKHPKNRRLLNDYTLNEAVQRILDRIVFIRVCEDREIEVENTLLAILRMWKERRGYSLYSLLNELFKQRRSLYNGLLFSQHQCEELEVGDEVLIKILENLNYPFSPYHFNEIGVEILGSIYEKFLGKTIHLTAKTTRIEEKPEVRKAGGVYYTPQYIVKYIVDNTLGKLLYEEKTAAATDGRGMRDAEVNDLGYKDGGDGIQPTSTTSATENMLKLPPKQVAKLKIIDIACGSGSFLLGAFQKLIDYHIEWYTEHPEDIKIENNVPDAYKDADGNYHLSPRKKRDILVNNIYGVDIDRQAVEVTQMSLYLKVLEGENAETLNPQMTLALKEVYLPSLAKNIKCGNSLIGTDFTSQGEMFNDEARRKVNPFDWELEFPEILGSKQTPTPPDRRAGQSPPIGGEVPTFSVGTEGVRTSEGSQGFDVVIGNPPYGMVHDEDYKNYYVDKYETPEGRFDTFEIFIEKGIKLCGKNGLLGYIVPSPLLSNLYSRKLRRYLLNNHSIKQIINFGMDVFEDPTIHTCIVVVGKEKIKKNTVAMRKQVILQEQLYQPFDYEIVQSDLGDNENASIDIFIEPSSSGLLKKLNQNAIELGVICFIRQCIKTGDDETLVKSSKKLLKNPWKPTLRGRSIDRYMTNETDLYLKYGDWLARNWNNKTFYETPKIGIRETGNRIIATEDLENRYFLSSLYSIYPKSLEEKRALRYFLALLNSKLSTFFIKKIAFELTKGAFTKVRTNQLGRLPIRTIDFTKPIERKMHDDLVSLVEKMLGLNKQLQKAHYDSEKEPIERQIAATDKKIDDIVYELYGLTEEEIAIVEGKSS